MNTLSDGVVDMDSLFTNKLFYLVHVDDNGMSLVKPFGNKEMQKDIQEKGYRCISHVWGTADRTIDYVWRNHEIAGITWDVETRVEKRERLMQIFHHHRGYFWMDNLCIDQEAKAEDKPLEIMGDIYRKCTECVCMLDTSCNVSEFTSERDLMVDVAKDVKESLENKEHISERYRDKYPHDNYAGKGHMGYISSILCAGWFRRVWTWQEAALPPRVLFCSEYAGKYIYDPFDYEFLKDLFPYKFLELVDMNDRVECIIEEFGECNDDESAAEAAIGTISAISFIRPISELRRNLDIWDNIKLLTGSQRECTNEEDCVYGIMGVLNVNIPKGLGLRDSVEVLNKELKKQGIFVGNTGYYKKSNSISDMYHIRHLYDGVRVLGKVDDSEFNPNVGIIDHTYGEILSKNYLESTDFHHKRGEKYENVHHEYTTETLVIRLETDRFNVGDMLELTKIGRRGCTFEHQHNSSDKDIFETIGNRVKIVGYTM